MIDCVSVANMRRSDRQTIEDGMPSVELIYRAAYSVFRSLEWSEPAAIVCGSGNNGADGFALACILHDNGLPCSVFTVSNRLHEDAAFYAEQARSRGVPIVPYELGVLDGYSLIVDCMLGTGFQGVPRTPYAQAIKEINDSRAYVVSVDINSGMSGDSGLGETVVVSDLTVAIGYVKNGQVQSHAGEFVKRLICVDVGIGLTETENKICTPDEWERLCTESKIEAKMDFADIDGVKYFLCPPWVHMEKFDYV